jgi:hypothetical protein
MFNFGSCVGDETKPRPIKKAGRRICGSGGKDDMVLNSKGLLLVVVACALGLSACAQERDAAIPAMQREAYERRQREQAAPTQVPPAPGGQPSKITINENHVLVVNGRELFPIGFTLPPPPDGKAPNGKTAYEEWRSAGATFFRTGPSNEVTWDDTYIQKERAWMDAAARAGMYTLPWLKELSEIGPGETEKEQRLRHVINLFKDHPGMGVWKGSDEPQWGKVPVHELERAQKIIHETDPNHPLWIVEAPRGTVDELREYDHTRDITGVDIYPVSFPPGIHSLLPNDQISLVGDHTRIMMDVSRGRKPVWLTLQISWSGVVKEGRTLVMPTFHQERFMTYQAIINGARGLIYFGGHNPQAWSPRDKELGWNWTFWENVLRRIIEEIGDKSPLHPALVAQNSEIALRARQVGVDHAPAKGVEFLVREVGNEIFLFACRREGDATQIRFENLPPGLEPVAEVMYESPRTVKVVDNTLTDWFGPFDVHVYRIKRK